MENKQILNTYKQINFIYYEFFKNYYSNNVVYNEYKKILNNFYKTRTFKKFLVINKTDLTNTICDLYIMAFKIEINNILGYILQQIIDEDNKK